MKTHLLHLQPKSVWFLLILTLIPALVAGCMAAEALSVTPTPQPTSPVVVEPDPTPEPTTAAQPTLNLPAEMLNTTWYWVELLPDDGGPLAVESPESYTLTLLPDGRFTLTADCNSVAGRYAYDGQGLSLQAEVSTMAECGPASRYGEYLTLLGSARAFFLEGTNLLLATDDGTMAFARNPQPRSPLSGTWAWVETQGQNALAPSAGTYTLRIQDDGTLVVQADCNRAAGTVKAAGTMLSVVLGPTTLAECGPDSLSAQFLRQLGTVRHHALRDGHLWLKLADGGTMVLAPVQ